MKKLDLHDAKVLTLAADAAPHFSIFLQAKGLPAPVDQSIELRYRLAGGLKHGLKLIRHPALAEDGTPFGWWLYDEIDIVRGPAPVFRHSILFTGGVEIQLFFYGMTRRRLRLLFPSSIEAAGTVEEQMELLGA